MARDSWHSRFVAPIAAALLIGQLAYVAPALAADPTPAPVASDLPAPIEVPPTTMPSASPAPTPSPVVAPAPNAVPTQATPPTAAPVVTPAPSPTPEPAPSDGTIGLLPPLPDGATEVTAKRTDTSRTYRDATGKTVTELYTNPVFYRPEGKATLEPVRLGYLRSADGKGAVSDTAPMTVTVSPATDPAGFLTVQAAGYTIRYRPLTIKGLPAGASAAASIDGGAADLKDVIPGVDLRVLARARTASVFFILDQAADAGKLQFAIDAPGLTAVVNEDGQVVFTDATGAEVVRMSHPWAMDSTPDTTGLGSGRMTGGVSVALQGAASPYTATVTVDAAWLKDAVYPVYVDPTLALADTSSSDDAFVNAGNNIVYGEYCRPDSPYYCELWLGQSPSPTTDVASVFMKWAPALFEGMGLDSASLQFFPYHQWSHATAKNTWVWQLADDAYTPWTESTLKYSTRPRTTTGSARTGSTAEDTWSDINILPIVRGWNADKATNYGIRIDENGNNYTYWKRLVSVEQTGSYVHVPRIVYTSHTLSAAPVPVATLGAGGSLTWTYANGGGRSQTQFQVDVAADSGFTQIIASSGTVSQSVAPGATGSWTEPALSDLTRYYWRVRVNDGTGWSARAIASIPFVYDALRRGAEPWHTAVPFDLGGGWGLDVSVHNGEARLARSLYAISGYGPAQGLDLAYGSANVAAPGLFGYGWSSNLTQTLWRNSATSPTLLVWNRPDGGRTVFTGSGTTFAPTAERFEQLIVSGTEWTVKTTDQTRLVFSLGSGVTTGKLARIEDRFGKQLGFTWGGTSATVTAPFGQPTTLNYPSGSLIESIVDPAGRTWLFHYDANTNLDWITEPTPNGGGACGALAPVTELTYASHALTRIRRHRCDASGGDATLDWTIGYTGGRAVTVIDPIAHAAYGDVASTFTYNAGSTVVALLKTYSPVFRNTRTYTLDGLGRVSSLTDPNTFVTRYGWNNPSSTLEWVETPIDGSTWTRTAYTYTGAGMVATETADALGDPVATAYTYNTSNDVTRTDVADASPDEVVTTHTYDTAGTGGTAGHLVTMTANALGASPQVTDYRYGANDLVSAERDPLGVVTLRGYDASGNETSAVANCVDDIGPQDWWACQPDGPHDAATNVTTTQAFAGTLATALGLPTTVTSPEGRYTTYTYDTLGRTLSEVRPDGTTTYEWDQLGSVVRRTAPGSLVTTRTLDLMNQVTTEAAPLLTTTTQYDAAGAVVQTTIASDISRQTYDGAGRLTAETIDPDHLNLTTDHAYDAAGHEIAVRGPDLTVTRTFYDALGQVSAIVQNCTSADSSPWSACKGDGVSNASTNLTTSYSYDARGNKVSESSPSGRVTTYVYDELDRLVKRVDNDVSVATLPTEDVTTEYAYDADGNQIAVKAPTSSGGANGYLVVRSFYDALGRVTQMIKNCTDSGTTPPATWQTCSGSGTKNAATNVVATYTYDADGNRLSETVPSPSAMSGTSGDYLSAVTTRYAYDAAGRLCRVLENAQETFQAGDACTVALVVAPTAASNVDTQYGYDSRGNLASMIDGRGNTTNYGYDDRGRMTSLAEPGVAALTWAYNDAARTKTQTNRTTGTVVWTSDAAGRLVSRAYQDASGAGQTTTYTYPAGTQDWTAQDSTGTIMVTNDHLGRPTGVAVSTDAGAATTYGYSHTAPTRTDASGSYTMATDNAGRVTAIDDPIHAANWTFGYGANGEPVTTVWPTATVLTTTASYDALGRLTSRSTTPGPVASYTLTYNRAGNRLTEASSISGDTSNGTATTGYDPLGRLSSYELPSLSRTVSAGWDAVPNRTSLTTNGIQVGTAFNAANRPTSNGYVYDADGRMTTRAGTAGTTFTYDSLGRLAEVRQNPGNTLVAKYTYDALDRLLKVQRSSGTIRFRYQGVTTAIAGVVDDGSGTTLRNVTTGPEGTVLEDWSGADRQLYGTNGHHDTTFTTGDAGTITTSVRYDPWGNVLASAGTVPDWRFQGSWTDTSTGLVWSVARWYDSAQGAFISEDSYLGSVYAPSSRHLFAYGAGDPLGGWDPTGAWTQSISVIKSQEKVLKHYETLKTLGWIWMAGDFTTGMGTVFAPAESRPNACIVRYLNWMVTGKFHFGAANSLEVTASAKATFKDGVVVTRRFHKFGSGEGIYRVPWQDSFVDSKNNRRYAVRLEYTVGWIWNHSGTGRFPKGGGVTVHGTLTTAQRNLLEQ